MTHEQDMDRGVQVGISFGRKTGDEVKASVDGARRLIDANEARRTR